MVKAKKARVVVVRTAVAVPIMDVAGKNEERNLVPSQASWLVGRSGMVNAGHWAWGTPKSESDFVD